MCTCPNYILSAYILRFLLNSIFIIFKVSQATVDLNAAQLQYLANHLTPEECRRLVASAHFKIIQAPKILDQAERKMPKDISCIEHLYHWNSEEGLGKGESHAFLTHRLRQMGKYQLAEWLGKTVFQEIGRDLEKSVKEGLDTFLEERYIVAMQVLNSGFLLYCRVTDQTFITIQTLHPKIEDPTTYTNFDSFLYMIAIAIILTIFGLCIKIMYDKIKENIKRRRLTKSKIYEEIETESSGSESEDRFDIRTYT
ncbi:uncharacterized protein LOC132700074 [Cylas formicarius]|uniref:uncharacterized protein LOC132700074 n=1 Tax=Cylas formicarius TaxID=197179 RepID=UPI0029587BA9|nr:uncharacterized protein LOC132700074 [Cylas formicarius]